MTSPSSTSSFHASYQHAISMLKAFGLNSGYMNNSKLNSNSSRRKLGEMVHHSFSIEKSIYHAKMPYPLYLN